MINIDKGAVSISGDGNLLMNEMAIGLMSVCESIAERTGETEENILEHILLSLQGQKLGRSGMSVEDMENIMGIEIDRERSKILNKG